MQFQKIAMRLNAKQFSKLVELGNRVVASMAGNLNFVTPSPTPLAAQSAITAVVNSQAVYGDVGNRGSRQDYIDLCEKAQTLWELLRALAAYVENTAIQLAGSNYTLMRTIISTSGFELANDKTPHPVLEQVRDFRIFKVNSLNKNQVEIRWKRPLNTTSANDVNIYEVYRSTTSNFTDAVKVASVTKTEFIDTNTSAVAVNWFYFVLAYNTAGTGAVSVALPVSLVGA